MNPLLTRIEGYVNRYDRNYSLWIGISSALTALWSVYRVFWAIYLATTLSSIGWSPVSLIFPIVLWGVIGVASTLAAVLFLRRYARQP